MRPGSWWERPHWPAGAASRNSPERSASAFVAVDVREGRVAVAGWSQTTELTPEELAERCATAGVRRLLCTAIDRDGTMGGPDLELLGRVRERSGLPVLAAGGIRSEDDLSALEALGLEGAVVGRALLEGAISLSRG